MNHLLDCVISEEGKNFILRTVKYLENDLLKYFFQMLLITNVRYYLIFIIEKKK